MGRQRSGHDRFEPPPQRGGVEERIFHPRVELTPREFFHGQRPAIDVKPLPVSESEPIK